MKGHHMLLFILFFPVTHQGCVDRILHHCHFHFLSSLTLTGKYNSQPQYAFETVFFQSLQLLLGIHKKISCSEQPKECRNQGKGTKQLAALISSTLYYVTQQAMVDTQL
jgi:hypothetical protein